MTCTNQQVKLLMKKLKTNNQKVAAAKAGMDVKTARKYIKLKKLPGELKKPHNWRTRKDSFDEVWDEIKELLEGSPRLQALTVLNYLIKKYKGEFHKNQLRTLQRRFRDWRALHGKEKSVIFCQTHKPGLQSQSDYTRMNKLQITISGKPFEHLLFHFMLVYSRWESVSICYSESFDSLVYGYEKAVWELGNIVTEHRTDNLSAAIKANGNRKAFTQRWLSVMKYYNVIPSTNNPGRSYENGSIEKSNDLLKKAIDQQLMLRGSRDFKNIDTYQLFLKQLIQSRNSVRKKAFLEELPHLKQLPKDRWYSPKIYPVKVTPMSTIHIEKVVYSVPSRFIGHTLKAHVYPDKIQLHYGQTKIQKIPKLQKRNLINYRHIVGQLIKKPGAFEYYKYQESLFPRLCFRQSYDQLKTNYPKTGHKKYIKILYLAKIHGEQKISTIMKNLFKSRRRTTPEIIKMYLNDKIAIPKIKISQPNLKVYDQLRQEVCTCVK